jgi:hypothetical protein
VKLPQKPSGKGKRGSQDATSTLPDEQVASPILEKEKEDASSPENQPPQAEDTPNPKRGNRILLLAPSETSLGIIEKRELAHLGVAMAQMPWLSLYANSPSFKMGVERAGGMTILPGDKEPNWFDGIIYYKIKKLHDREAVRSVLLPSLNMLQRFVSASVTELYRRGIIT